MLKKEYFFQKVNRQRKGFTFIELLVSISIIAILSAVIMGSFSSARKKARITKRISDLKQVQVSLAYYYSVNRSYPSTSGAWQTTIPSGFIPTYLSSMPADPQNSGTCTISSSNCYLYRSDGTDYAFIVNNVTEMSSSDYTAQPDLIDPYRDGTANGVVDGASVTAWKVYSSGGAAW